MSDVQPENGYCRIANELLDAIVRFPFTKRQYALLLAIVRRTYGFNKKTDTVTVWRLAEACGLGRQHASVALQELAAMNVITLRDSTRFSHGQPMKEVGIQKDYSTWFTVSKTGTVPKTATVPETGFDRTQNGSATVPKTGHTKDNHKRQTKDRKALRFAPPTLEQVREYCRQRGNSVDPERWIDHYTANGWKVGRNPMKDWRAAVRTWEKNTGGTNGNHQDSGRNSRADGAGDYFDAATADAYPWTRKGTG